MAGSFRHITNSDGSFSGMDLIENMRDASECIEECYDMIAYLTGGDKKKMWEAWKKGYAMKKLPQSNRSLFGYRGYWRGV